MLLSSAAEFSSVHAAEELLAFVLLQLILILLLARVAGNAARRLGQPRVVGEIIGGLMLGPSLFGRISPELFDYVFSNPGTAVPMSVLSQIGLILLMFQIGLDFDFSHLRQRDNRRIVLAVSAASILLPFAIGFGLARLSAPHLAPGVNVLGYELFMATAFSITAIPILGRIMMEFGLTKTRLGAVAITSAAINDVLGWLLLAVISALTISQFSPGSFGVQGALLATYILACQFLLRPLLCATIRHFRVQPDHLPGNLTAIMLAVIFASAIATQKLGIFALFGGFMIGVLLFREHAFVAAWQRKIAEFVTVFFLPIFFTYTGLRTDVHGLDSWALWGWCGLLTLGATVGKFTGTWIAARWSGMNSAEARCLGIMMNTRALMELIILNVGYDLGVIPTNVFTMLVLMAIFSTVITAPLLRLWLPRMGHAIPPRTADASGTD